MSKIDELQDLFFKDLKSYNSTNFRTLIKTDLKNNRDAAVVNKAFSSIVTRYFIFKEKHAGELTESEFNILYFKLKIDLISDYFSKYPDSDICTLISFQDQVKQYNEKVNNVKRQVTEV